MSNKVVSLGSASAAAAGIVITGATNATPIVITLSAGHNLKNGDRLAIAGITGNTNANGEAWTLANVTATTATLLGSSGNGTYGGTPRAAVVMDTTPHMKNHSAAMHLGGNLVGTLDIESYESYADFAAGTNNAGAIAPIMSPSVGTNSAGSSSTPAKTTITATAANAGIAAEVKLARFMRSVVTAYTSGSSGVFLEA